MTGTATLRGSAIRLGAIELIELGDPVPRVQRPYRVDPSRRPFLANRRAFGPSLGALDFLKDIGSFLTGAFEFIFKTLADIINVPLNLASQGVGVLFDGVAGLLRNVPILGPIAAELLIVSKAVIQWGLKVPGLLLEGIGNVFGEIKAAIDATKTPEQKKADQKTGTDNLLKKAEQKGGAPLKNAVQSAISGKPPEGVTGVPPKQDQDLPPGADQVGVPAKSDLEQILEVGLPVAAAATLLFTVMG